MRIALFGTPFPTQYNKYIQHLICKLELENVEILIHQEFYKFLEEEIKFKNEIETYERIIASDNIDYLFSIGGDGTLLRSVTYVRNSEIPIMGINTGRLGFISSISTDQIEV
ncbi:MAG: NAD(+)/NADH kinase, partial [Flavobacteriales bacterium]